VSRISSPSLLKKVKRFDIGDRDPELDEAMSTIRDEYGSRMEGYQITRACEGVIEVIMAVSGEWSVSSVLSALIRPFGSNLCPPCSVLCTESSRAELG
jgi:hypothetical protein